MGDNLFGGSLTAILQASDKHIIATVAKVPVFLCKQGSQLRRAGHTGVQKWVSLLLADGFDLNRHHINVYLSDTQQTTLEALLPEVMAKYLAAEIPVPDGGVLITDWPIVNEDTDIVPLDSTSLSLLIFFIIDGMHRISALRIILLRMCTKLQCHWTDPRVAKWAYVKAIIYHNEIRTDCVLMAKALNHQGQQCVVEDSIERLTFVKGMLMNFIQWRISQGRLPEGNLFAFNSNSSPIPLFTSTFDCS